MNRRLPFFYGWVVVGTIAAVLMGTNGARLVFGVVLKPLTDEFGWDRGSLTGAVLVNTVIISALQPFTGWMTDKAGPKRVFVLGTVAIGGMLIALSFAQSLAQVYLFYGVLGGVVLTASSPVIATSIVHEWFATRRAAALAVATAGAPLGQLAVVPVAALVLDATDWQTTYRVLAILLIAVIVPVGWLFLRETPAEMGLNPDGASDAEVTARSSSQAGHLAGVDLKTALRERRFWFLAFGFLVCGFTMAFANTHFMAYADDMGMHTSMASSSVAVTAVFSVLGTIALGLAADRTRRPPVLALTYALRGLAFFLLFALPTGSFVYVYAVVLGISWSATTPLTAAIAADIYGRANLGLIFGTMYTTMNLGFGIGAVLDGLIFDAVGDYQPALVINGLVGLSAAGLIYLPRCFGAKSGALFEQNVSAGPVQQPQLIPGD
jgi:MFS family permease